MICDTCKLDKVIVLELKAADHGHGGIRHECAACYKLVLESMHVGPVIESPPVGVAEKRAANKRSKPEPERSSAKEDVGSFERPPPEERRRSPTGHAYTGGIQYVPDEEGYW